MTPDDPRLMAYADGQLHGEEAARVEAAIAADPSLAARVSAHQALGRHLREAYAPALEEPVPVGLRAAAAGDVRVLPVRPRARGGWRVGLAMAATLVFGLALGLLMGRPGTAPFASDAQGRWVAQGELAQALGEKLAAQNDGTIDIGLSFRDDRGHWCRSFRVQAATSLAGLACREQQAWHIAVLAASETSGGELVQAAAAIPPPVLAEIDARLVGEPLDAAQERAARDAGWR